MKDWVTILPMKKLLYFLLSLSIFTVFSCNQSKVDVITSEKFLLSPIRAAEFFSFYSKRGLNVCVDAVDSPKKLIRFLNFSTYNVVLTDKKTADFITSNLNSWVKLCKIARWRGDFYYLLVRNSLLKEQKLVIAFLKGWNFGVDCLKDPAVVRVLEERDGIFLPKNVKFFSCKGW